MSSNSNTPTNGPELLSDDQLAPILNVSVGFLRKDRRHDKRIPFYRIGDRCLYDLTRVREALRALEEGGAPVKNRKTRRESSVGA